MSSPENQAVIAVIPNYNMSETLVSLVRQVLQQEYAGVYVLDDHSTECDIEEIMKPFGSAVTLIAGSENRGAGGNRNRILEADSRPLGGAILHFIDADCELLSTNIPAQARRLFANDRVGAVGGLILNADDSVYAYNYNPRISLHWGFAVNAQAVVAAVGQRAPGRAKRLRRAFEKTLTGFPDIHAEPAAREVFCVPEANMLIPYDIFKAVGGFDDRLRYHEAQDLAHKLAAQGLAERWEPSVAVRHHAVNVRGKSRVIENWRSAYVVARKHGLPFR